MKIAIQGHPTRGKEVIQILESLGGINDILLDGSKEYWYFINSDRYIRNDYKSILQFNGFKTYTLEEFKKEFPFKIGDEVIFPVKIGWMSGKVIGLTYRKDKLKYKIDTRTCGYHYIEPSKLSLYPMKEERNITLTLDKAKEWYKKGGELREVALQAYSEEELKSLPRSWEEFCEKYPVKKGECYLGIRDTINTVPYDSDERGHKNWIPSKKSAEAHLAMMQLEQLRNCYNDNSDAWGWSYSIIKRSGIPELVRGCDHDTFLRFKNEAIARQFLECFRDLIEKAGDLI